MPGPTAAARAALVAALTPVWPGRVWPYRPTQPRPTAGIYVGKVGGGWLTDGAWGGQFQVHLVADGADHAAQAMLDDLIDQVYAAVAGSANFYPDAFEWDPFDADAVTVLPATTFIVRVELDVATWCPPADPTAVTIPPQPIGA